MAITERQLTLEQFPELPKEEPTLEYVDGVVTQKMSPKGPHGKLQSVRTRSIEALAQPPGVASAFTETRVTFDGGSPAPDVIVYRSDRVPADHHGDIAEDFYEPPDIAVEIWSPGQTLKDLVDRCHWYVEHGVPVALFVHPRRRRVRVFRTASESGPFTGADRIDLGDVLPSFVLSVAELFHSLRARPD